MQPRLVYILVCCYHSCTILKMIVYYRELRYDKFCRRMAQLWITALLIAHGVEVIQTENCVGCSSLCTQFSLSEFAVLVLFTVYCWVGQTRPIKTFLAKHACEA